MLNNQLITKDSWIKNISQVEIPSNVIKFLSLGPKFSIGPRLGIDSPTKPLLSDIDFISSFIPDPDCRNIAIARSINIITNNSFKRRSSPSLLQNLLEETKRFLKSHPELVVTQSDKGNVTVVMLKDDYFKLSQEILDQGSSYITLPSDPTSNIQNKSNAIKKRLWQQKQIDLNTEKRLSSYKSVVAKFYTLPKIHKPSLTMRPIVSSIGSPTEHIAGFLTNILTKAYDSNNDYYIRDSFQVVELFNRTVLPHNYVLVSLDVVSLLSNVYLNAVFRSIHKHWNKISQVCSIDYDMFIEMIEFLFNSTCFSFKNKYYKQTFGTPMGASIPPILATYVMDDLLNIILQVVPFIKKWFSTEGKQSSDLLQSMQTT
ncbi:uncharacterized protein [Diabrotica undecimpunctata]|uniref:uncharacterized protein n=1 Tax=Diabrotica undecimpunctata TaxID=50387 RepID=UPI003B63DB63